MTDDEDIKAQFMSTLEVGARNEERSEISFFDLNEVEQKMMSDVKTITRCLSASLLIVFAIMTMDNITMPVDYFASGPNGETTPVKPIAVKTRIFD